MLKLISNKRIILRLVKDFPSVRLCSHSVNLADDPHFDSTNFVKDFLTKHPKISMDNVNSCYKIFKDAGISEDVIPEVLNGCPDLARIPAQRFQETLNSWMGINIGPDLIKLITVNPSVLFLSKRHVESRYIALVDALGNRSISKIIINAPLLLTEPLEDIKSKIKYLEKQLLYSREELLKSKAFNCTLEHIKLRFEFMRLTGVYKVPKAKTLLADKLVNPRLSKILFSSDYEFATKIVGVSMLEFNIFVDMKLKEDEDTDNEYEHSAVIDVT